MTGMSVSPLQLAQGIAGAARQAGQDAPAVRRADWQTGIITAVNGDGTVDIGSIRARRIQTYTNPAVGDQIVISQSGNGNWIALGRVATTTRSWTAFTLSSGWTPFAAYYTPSYRIWNDGTASLCGLAQMSGTLTSGAVVATLPAEATPASQVRCAVQVASGYFGVMTIYTNGQIQLGDFSGTLPTTGSKWAEYDAFGRYRLV
jgi:hypothetical protein